MLPIWSIDPQGLTMGIRTLTPYGLTCGYTTEAMVEDRALLCLQPMRCVAYMVEPLYRSLCAYPVHELIRE